jgi:hypothetical protein
MFKDKEIMDHYNQSVHTMLCRDKKKRGRIPLAMMERNIKHFSKPGTEKLGKAARISGDVVRVRRANDANG